MAETTGGLRRDLSEQRTEIAHTLDEIQNRVSPGRVWARERHRIRHRVTDWKDRIMGKDEPYYSGSYGGGQQGPTVGEKVTEARDALASAPDALRRQTQGNPLAAGLIAFGAGLLVASLIPETQREQQMAQGIQPMVSDAVGEAKSAVSTIAEEMRGPAEEAVQEVKDVAQQAATEVQETARSGIEEVQKESSDSGQ